MPYSNPYQPLFDAVLTVLRGLVEKDEQVRTWADEEVDDLAPSERLIEALSRNAPTILLSWSDGSSDQDLGGFNAGNEEFIFTVRFGLGVPERDRYDRAHSGAGANYPGAFDLYDDILDGLIGLATSSDLAAALWQLPLRMISSRQIPLDGIGRLGRRMTFSVKRTREYAT